MDVPEFSVFLYYVMTYNDDIAANAHTNWHCRCRGFFLLSLFFFAGCHVAKAETKHEFEWTDTSSTHLIF